MSDLAAEATLQSALRSSKAYEGKGDLEAAVGALRAADSCLDQGLPATAWKVVKRLATLSNRLATVGQTNAMERLHEAESALAAHIHRLQRLGGTVPPAVFVLQNLTWNNVATWHKQRGSHNHALQYLQKAVKLGEAVGILRDVEALHAMAQTRLNMSAVYSEMGKHEEAVSLAEKCLELLQKEMGLRGDRSRGKQKFGAMIVLFVVAFYNIGVSEEALQHKSAALEAFQNSVAIGSKHLRATNPALALARKALTDTLNSADGSGLSPQWHVEDKGQVVSCIPTPGTESPVTPRDAEGRRKAVKRTLTVATAPHSEERKKILRLTRASSHRTMMPKSVELPRGRTPSNFPSPQLPPNVEDEKYYSKKELEKLRKKLEAGSRVKFVSSDQYFLTKITKTLNVTRDIQHLRPFTTSSAMGAWEKDEEDKRLVSALRLKRHPQTGRTASQHGLEVAQKLINRLKAEDEQLSKRNSIKSQSRMKTKAFRQSLSLSKPRDSGPPQRLFFKPYADGTPDRVVIPESEGFEPVATRPSRPNLAKAKEEIEKMMDEINNDLRGLAEKTDTPRKARSASDTNKRNCDLAHSTIKLGELKQATAKPSAKKFTRESVEQLVGVMDRKRIASKAVSRSPTYKPPVTYPYS